MKRIDWWRLKLGADSRRSKGPEDFWTICPCHIDAAPSLHVDVFKNETGNAIRMHCFVCGANGVDVCHQLGLSRVYLNNYEEASFCEEKQPVRAAAKPPITVDWNVALDMAACAVVDKITELTGDCQLAGDQLIDGLVSAFSDRLGSLVSGKIDRRIEAATRPTDKTVCADGFEQKEKRPGGRGDYC